MGRAGKEGGSIGSERGRGCSVSCVARCARKTGGNCSTVEDEILVEPVDAPEIVDDFEFEEIDSQDIKDREVNKLKLRRRIEQYKLSTYRFAIVYVLPEKLFIFSFV
ncbi:hypothetical protein GOP47_0001702 [Adiantum capillus-veneris]|uniref:Uncharacterized protein n=1 Tax=Adiantum capillus-veneris TaxID=13818 RepID=A0A9D4V8W0_ADICA|nr:hypothetical protein GOP47_0001702 [Adiantum capillus-veneris]